MSISMEQFGWSSVCENSVSFREKARLSHPFQLQCRACGFEPDDQITAPRYCPKCASSAWERFVKPGSLLDNVGPGDPEFAPTTDDELDA
jgi:Zn finger protein HypA/HybF involved in hydrogenase expression